MNQFHINLGVEDWKKGSVPIFDRASTITPWTEKVWEWIRFTVVTGMIFVVAFVALNAQAYRQIATNILNPEAQASTQRVLEKVVDRNPKNQNHLLATAPGEKEARKKFDHIDLPIAPTDNRIIIPKIGKNAPLVEMSTEHIEGENWHELENQIQDGLRNGVVHYPGTAKPGQFGNVFLTGHSSYYPWDNGKYKDIFALLGQLEIGEEFYIYYDQKRYVYRIQSKEEVQPDNVSVLSQPKDRRIATLMTCTPVGTTLRRLIITAEQVI